MNDHLEPTDNAPLQGSAPAPVPGVSDFSSAEPVLKNAGAPPLRVAVRNGPRAAHRPAKRPTPQRRPANGPAGTPRPPRAAGPAGPKRPPQSGNAARPARPAHHHAMLVDETDDGFVAKHRVKIIAAAIAVVVGGGAYFVTTSKPSTTSKAPEMVKISLPPMPHIQPPPPPPPPKVPPPPQKAEKMVAETQPEDKPQEAPKPVAALTETLGTNLKGDGAGMAGLGGSGNGGGFGGGGGRGGSKWGWYAGEVQRTVASALRSNSKTRTASIKEITVRIWPDSNGRIIRAKLDNSTGDPKLDDIIRNQVLTGIQLQDPPPAGMPAPIVLRMTASRPH